MGTSQVISDVSLIVCLERHKMRLVSVLRRTAGLIYIAAEGLVKGHFSCATILKDGSTGGQINGGTLDELMIMR